jgi:predicted molibdopterin-dependent oxidoreductase YjgC
MFAPLPDNRGARVEVVIDGVPHVARAGDSVAAALLASGEQVFRVTPVGGAVRGPYCLMGACFDCLVTVDGRSNQQGCRTLVAAGMRIETQRMERPRIESSGRVEP